MSNPEYRCVTEILNDMDSSFVPDAAFHPDGTYYAISYRDNNQVRIYNTLSSTLLRTYQNPKAQLDFPHGLLVTENHIIVSNKLNALSMEPSKLTVYRIDDPSGEPVSVFTTPLEHLREAHSMDIHNGLLFVTYCGKDIGAILTYAFDDETGKIAGPLSVLEDWFSRYGEPKGLCINEDGSKAFVTMAIEDTSKNSYKGPAINDKLRKVHHWEILLSRLFRRKREINHHFNGVVIFSVDQDGALSKEPVQIFQSESRLENINIVSDRCVVTDPLNDRVCIYNLDPAAPRTPGLLRGVWIGLSGKGVEVENGDYFDHPIQILKEHLAFPHDACFSPDKKLLIVTNYGIEIIEGEPQWEKFRQPRSDKISIYERVD